MKGMNYCTFEEVHALSMLFVYIYYLVLNTISISHDACVFKQ
jgi:hypothetical protein